MFGEFKILTVTSLYIFEILCFIIKNKFIQLSILIFIVTTQYANIIGMSNYAILPAVKKV
jgi:hypothetical protein